MCAIAFLSADIGGDDYQQQHQKKSSHRINILYGKSRCFFYADSIYGSLLINKKMLSEIFARNAAEGGDG